MENLMPGLCILEHPKLFNPKAFFWFANAAQIGLVFCLESTNKLQPAFVHDYGSIVATQIFKNLYS